MKFIIKTIDLILKKYFHIFVIFSYSEAHLIKNHYIYHINRMIILTIRFSLYLPTRLFENLNSDFYSKNYNCSSPLHNHPIKKLFNHSEFHDDIINFILETHKVEPSLLNPRLIGLQKSFLWTVFRSKECVNDVEDCLVIVASNYGGTSISFCLIFRIGIKITFRFRSIMINACFGVDIY